MVKYSRNRTSPAIKDEGQQPTLSGFLYYGLPLTVRRLSEVYNVSHQTMNVWLCRSEFDKHRVEGRKTPQYFTWSKEFEVKLDDWCSKKGYRRCIGSRVPSKYLSGVGSLS